MMIWLRWEQGPSPTDQCGNCQRDWSNVTRLSSRHGTVVATVVYNYYAHAQHSKYSTYSGNVQPSSHTLYFWSFFGIPPWIFRPKGQIECLTLPVVCSRPISLLHTDVAKDWPKQCLAHWHHRHYDLLRTCVCYIYHGNTVIIGREDREEMVSVWRTDGIIRLS